MIKKIFSRRFHSRKQQVPLTIFFNSFSSLVGKKGLNRKERLGYVGISVVLKNKLVEFQKVTLGE
jgi:hypothetical protein